MDVKQMMTKNETSAEYWGDLISDCLIHLNDEYESHVGGDRLADLTGWLHEDGNGGEGHWFETAPCYCLHVFADGSFMDCEHGDVLTFEQAAEEMRKILTDEELLDDDELRGKFAVLQVLAKVVNAAIERSKTAPLKGFGG